jgi:alcohol dehydrogenase
MQKIFTFTGAKKIAFGVGSFDNLPDYLGELKAKRPLVVMDPALAASGLKERIQDLLGPKGFKMAFYDKVEPEPRLELADEGAKAAIKGNCDAVVGIGGGSAMDVAKAVAVLAANKGKAADYLGLGKVPGPGLPKIMIPTTAGTGSEVTFTSVFVRKNLKKKEGMNSPYLYPELAVLDPLLTLTLPPYPTATTGVDALCHAIESYTSINASPMSEMISLEAIMLIAENLRTCVHDGRNLEAREKNAPRKPLCRTGTGQCGRHGCPLSVLSPGRKIRGSSWPGQHPASPSCDGLQSSRRLGKIRRYR